MSDIKSIQDGIKAESAKALDELQALRDEIRLKIHLAGAEGRDVWDKLEPQLNQFEQRVGNAAEAAVEELKSTGSELKANLERFYQSLRSRSES